jgi:hypothetical protein
MPISWAAITSSDTASMWLPSEVRGIDTDGAERWSP